MVRLFQKFNLTGDSGSEMKNTSVESQNQIQKVVDLTYNVTISINV